MKMLSFLVFSFFYYEGENTILQNKESNVLSLRCLMEDTLEACIVLQDNVGRLNVTKLSLKLVDTYNSMDNETLLAIEKQNLTLLSEHDLLSIPPGIVLLIPAIHFSQIKGEILVKLIKYWYKEKIVFKHLLKAAVYSNEEDYFSEVLLSMDLSEDVLEEIAAQVASSNRSHITQLLRKPPLIFYSTPKSILTDATYERIFYLIFSEKYNITSSKKNKCLRLWAYVMMKNKFPVPIEDWNEFYLDRWGLILTGAINEELQSISKSNISSLKKLLNYDFSILQIRYLFNIYYNNSLVLTKWDYVQVENVLHLLLPKQLQKIPVSFVKYEDADSDLPTSSSLSTSKQIVEYMLLKNNLTSLNGIPTESNTYETMLKLTKKYIYSLPLMFLQKSASKSISLLIETQSEHLSKAQIYFLTNRGSLINFESIHFFQCKELLLALPTRDIVMNITSPFINIHLLKYFSPSMYEPQKYAILQKMWNLLSEDTFFQVILTNEHFQTLLDYLPSEYISRNADRFLRIFSTTKNVEKLNLLPDNFLSILLRTHKNRENIQSLLDLTEPYNVLLNGISCLDITDMDSFDFVLVMSRFKELRRKSAKNLPKKLQHCFIRKLLEHLEMKSAVTQQFLDDNILTLLREEDIDSLEGDVFTALPVKAIAKSKRLNAILKSIGKLSLNDLLISTPLSKLQELAKLSSDVASIDFQLFNIGNLVLFLDKPFINKINSTIFKIFLESGSKDQRICANTSIRSAWSKLILSAFGQPETWSEQTLITLNDFLIVIEEADLNRVNQDSLANVADLLTTKYFDKLEYKKLSKYYEVCASMLQENEAHLYTEELKKLVYFYVKGAQIQLETVMSAEQLLRLNPTENTSNFIDYKLKILLPTMKILDSYNAGNIRTTASTISNAPAQENIPLYDSATTFLAVDDSGTSVDNEAFTRASTNAPLYEVVTFDDNLIENPIEKIFNGDEGKKNNKISSVNSGASETENSDNVLINTVENIPSHVSSTAFFSISESITSVDSEGLSTHAHVPENTAVDVNFTNSPAENTFVEDANQSRQSTAYPETSDSENVSDNHGAAENNTSHNSTTTFFAMSDSSTVGKGIVSRTYTLANESATDVTLADNPAKKTFDRVESEFTKSSVYPDTSETTNSDTFSTNHDDTVENIPSYDSNISFFAISENKISMDNEVSTSTPTYAPPVHESTTFNFKSSSAGYESEKFTKSKADISENDFSNDNGVAENIPSLDSSPFIEIDNSITSEDKVLFFTSPSTHVKPHSTSSVPVPTSDILTSQEKSLLFTEKGSSIDENIGLGSPYFTKSESVSQKLSYSSATTVTKQNSYEENNLTSEGNSKTSTADLAPQSDETNTPSTTETNEIETIIHKTTSYFYFKSIKFPIAIRKNVKVLEGLLKRNRRTALQFNKITCDAMKMVGVAVEIILTEDLIHEMSDEDLNNCVDLFGAMDLPFNIQRQIWNRIEKNDLVITEKLIQACELSDIENFNFSIANPWTLEIIHLFGLHNKNPEISNHIVREVLDSVEGPLSVELAVSLGSLLCDLPFLNADTLPPRVFAQASVALGRSLPCILPCLRDLAVVAKDNNAFSDPAYWTSEDVTTLGIIAAGLEKEEWRTLMESEMEAWHGLSWAALECLPDETTQMFQEYNVTMDFTFEENSKDFYEIFEENSTDTQEIHSSSTANENFNSSTLLIYSIVLINLLLIIL